MGIYGFNIVEAPSVPVGQFAVNTDEAVIFVNPGYIDEFMNKLRTECEDENGERAFAA